MRLCLPRGIWQTEGVVKFRQPFLTTESQKDFPRTPAEMKGSRSRISVTNTASNLRAEMAKHKGKQAPKIQQLPSFLRSPHRDPASVSELRGGRPDLTHSPAETSQRKSKRATHSRARTYRREETLLSTTSHLPG